MFFKNYTQHTQTKHFGFFTQSPDYISLTNFDFTCLGCFVGKGRRIHMHSQFWSINPSLLCKSELWKARGACHAHSLLNNAEKVKHIEIAPILLHISSFLLRSHGEEGAKLLYFSHHSTAVWLFAFMGEEQSIKAKDQITALQASESSDLNLSSMWAL